jgi:hypothetical protein
MREGEAEGVAHKFKHQQLKEVLRIVSSNLITIILFLFPI